jgi:excisionase family DNA binding protein
MSVTDDDQIRDIVAGRGDRWFLRPKDVAALVGLSEAEVYKSIYSGDLRAVKYKERAWLIAEDDVAVWIRRFTEPNAA